MNGLHGLEGRATCHPICMPSAADLLRSHLSLVGKSATPEELADIYADDFVAEFPYAPEDHTRRLEGPEAIGRFLENIGKFAEAFKLASRPSTRRQPAASRSITETQSSSPPAAPIRRITSRS